MTRRDPIDSAERGPRELRPPLGDFAGRIGRTRDASTPAWPRRPSAPAGAPNVVIVYMDDMGFSDPGCFGGEIDTPHIDALAARGLRFTHYTTHPLCSPARAALLTGINAHAVGTGWLTNTSPGYPGYSGEIPPDAATLPETLRAAGYETIMVGKWHNTPTRDCVPSAPKHTWPTSRGFDTFYGFMEGEAHFFFPAQLMMGTQLVPVDEYPRDYYTTDDWTDRAIQYLKELRASSPTKPFLLYLAHNAVHAPLQAKPADLARYRGRYDAGWTAMRQARLEKQIELGVAPPDTRLPASDPRVPSWDATDPADRPLLARHMEVYAAMLDSVDQNLGRLVAFLRGDRRAGQHDPRVRLGQRRDRRGRADRDVQQQPPVHGAGGAADRGGARRRPRPGEPPGRPALPDRLGRGVEHAVPLVQDVHRRRAGGACRSSCPGRPASAGPARSAGSSCT